MTSVCCTDGGRQRSLWWRVEWHSGKSFEQTADEAMMWISDDVSAVFWNFRAAVVRG